MKVGREEMLTITAERRIEAALKRKQSSVQPFLSKEGEKVGVYREDSKK